MYFKKDLHMKHRSQLHLFGHLHPMRPQRKALLTGSETGLLGTARVCTTGRRAHSFLAVPPPALM